jgi:hypothetical protein
MVDIEGSDRLGDAARLVAGEAVSAQPRFRIAAKTSARMAARW